MKKLSPEKQKEFIDEARPVLEAVRMDLVPVIESGGMVQAAVIILGVTGEPRVVQLQKWIDKDKNIAADMMRSFQELPGVLATLFVTESWMSSYTKEEYEAAGGKPENLVPPSQNPKRKEAVVMMLETRVGALFSECEIFRNPDRLGPLNIHADSLNEPPPEGRFTGGFVRKQDSNLDLNSLFNHFKQQGNLKP